MEKCILVYLILGISLLTPTCAGDLLQSSITTDKAEVEAGDSVVYTITSRYTPGYPATLENEEALITFVGLYGFSYNKDLASNYVQCNLKESTTGNSKFFQVRIEDFTSDKELQCTITMLMSASLPPGANFDQNIVISWDQRDAEEDAPKVPKTTEIDTTLTVPKIKFSLALNDGLDKFYTCGPPYLGINLIFDFPKSDLTDMDIKLRWPLGGSNPDIEIISIPSTDFGIVKEGSGVSAGALTATQATGDLTAGTFRLVNIQASGQSNAETKDVVIETKLKVINEFLPLPFNSTITIEATLTHPTKADDTEISLSYTADITFRLEGPEMKQRWECDQDVNGGYTAYCYVWVSNQNNSTAPAQNVKLTFADTDNQVVLDKDFIEYTEPYSIHAADLPTVKPGVYTGNVDTGLLLSATLKVNKQIKIKIPIKIGTANVGPIKATKMTLSFENDYTDPCKKNMEEQQLDFVMMVPTFPVEPEELKKYFPDNMVIGDVKNFIFPMQIPQGIVDMTIILTSEAHGTEKTTYGRYARDTDDALTYFKALEILNVTVESDYTNQIEKRPLDAGFGFTFAKFTNPLDTEITSADEVKFNIWLKMGEDEFLDSGDIIKLKWAFVVNGYTYDKIFNLTVGEPDIGFRFYTYEDGGRIHWNISAVQEPGIDRSTAYKVTYKAAFNKDIPVVADSYSKIDFQAEKVYSEVVDQYWWYRGDHTIGESFNLGFQTYLSDSGEITLIAEYQALARDTSRKYNSTFIYPVKLHQSNSARNLRVGLAAAVCFFIGVLCAMLVMLVCCKRTTVLPLPTKFELYSRRPVMRINRWIKERGELLLTAELADDLVEALTQKEYKHSLESLDRLDIAHTVHTEEEMCKQQRNLVFESVGWIVTVSDLKEEGKNLFQQLDKDYKKAEVDLIDEEIHKGKELETELQKSARDAQEKLMDQQDSELDALVTVLQSVPFQERVDFIELMKQQHEVQRNDLESLLRMQLEEAREKLRRDYMVRKRVSVNLLVKEFFETLADESNLNNDVKEDLVSRSKHYIEVIDEAFHEEMCRNKFVLEERLLKREAILRIKEERVKYHNNLMMSVSSSMKQTINRLIRESLIKRSYGEELLSQINITSNENKAAMMGIMKNYEDSVRDSVRSKAQDKARKLLNSHLEAYEMFQQKYNDKLSRKEISPAEFLERKIRFHIGKRMEEEELMEEIDAMIAQELAMIWDHFTSESIARFRDNQDRIFDTLIKRAIIGSSQTEVQRQRNFRDQTKLENEKNSAITVIETALQQRITDSEERIKCQVEAEKLEQTALKEQEAKMVERLLESQLVMNQETRDNVMREHKRNLLELEEGLTVQKLRYKRKKQERLSAKTARKLEKLEQKQMDERELFRNGDGRTDDTVQTMLRRHQDERMDLLATVEQLDLNEAEQIHDEIMTEKSITLTDQKRRLASMLASLQVEKSREVATLRGQLNSLTKVELNLIDDLSSRGVLQDTKVKEMIGAHLKDMEEKIKELNEGKERQNKILQARLDNKLKTLEEELVARHQNQAEDITDKASKSPAYMYKKMLLLQKQKNERLQLRDNLRIETDQSVEELERKFELLRLREIKMKELKFISKLIEHADFDKEELADVFKAMFVTRSKEELDGLLQNAKVLTPEEKERRGPISLLGKAKEELVRRQSSQRFQLSTKRQGLLKPKIRPRRSKDAAQMFPRSIRTVAQEALITRMNSRSITPSAM